MEAFVDPKFRFIPLKFAWAAIHPAPVGIIYFIGGAGFGSLPTLFYRFFLKRLFQKGYTVVALPFRFSFRHWSVALSLVENQAALRESLQAEFNRLGYPRQVDGVSENDRPLPVNEYWIGHSLGCKYIALLELLTDYEIFERQSQLDYCLGKTQARRIDTLLDQSALASVSLYNQPAILVDPVISDLDNAIPVKSLRLLFERVISVLPSRQETFCLVDQSRLFALTSIIAFDSQLARTSVGKLKQLLAQRLLDFRTLVVGKSLWGKHLAILGIGTGDSAIVEAVIKVLDAAAAALTVQSP